MDNPEADPRALIAEIEQAFGRAKAAAQGDLPQLDLDPVRLQSKERAPATMITCISCSDCSQQGRLEAALFVMEPDFPRIRLDLELAAYVTDFLPALFSMPIEQGVLEVTYHSTEPGTQPRHDLLDLRIGHVSSWHRSARRRRGCSRALAPDPRLARACDGE